MKVLFFALLIVMLHATAFCQEDGYLSEAGTNDNAIIKKNKITMEVA